MRMMLAALSLLIGFGGPFVPGAAARQEVTLTVSAASDLSLAFVEIGEAFQQESGIGVDFNFGSTGQLTLQIEAGAPVDVFAAANVSYIDRLATADLVIDETQSIYARGQIVLWTRPDGDLAIETIDRLADDDIERIAIANPDHAPYGQAARDALISAGIWEQVQSKLVLGENISDTLQYAGTGNVDVAIVALSLALPSDGTWSLIPQELYPPIDQGLAVIESTAHEAEARAFVEFVNSERGRAIMRGYGFLLPGESLTEATPAPASPTS